MLAIIIKPHFNFQDGYVFKLILYNYLLLAIQSRMWNFLFFFRVLAIFVVDFTTICHGNSSTTLIFTSLCTYMYHATLLKTICIFVSYPKMQLNFYIIYKNIYFTAVIQVFSWDASLRVTQIDKTSIIQLLWSTPWC